MDYNSVLEQLKEASLFDLFRVNCAIDLLLNDPEKLRIIKRQLRINQKISYFDQQRNGLVEAVIVEIKKSNILVQTLETPPKRWILPLYMLNIDAVNTDIQSLRSKKGLDKTAVKVGDLVGFLGHENEEKYGVVKKLNQKLLLSWWMAKINGGFRISYYLM